MSKKYRLSDAWPDWLNTGGIFTLLAAVQGGSWIPWTAPANLLDLDYYGNNSGDKIASPLLSKMLEAGDGTLDAVAQAKLALVVYHKYNANWAKRWAALQAEYNPLENYSMEETETEDTTNTGTVGNVSTLTGSASRNNTEETDATIDKSVYGFDSSQASPSESETDHSETTATETSTESQSGNNTRTDNLAGTRDRTLTRSGNIGVTTSQQMLQSELDIRMYDFYKSVYDDIDHILTIPVY